MYFSSAESVFRHPWLVAALWCGFGAHAAEPNNASLQLPRPITFEINGDRLRPESDEALDFVERHLRGLPPRHGVRIEVHTDALGDERANQHLSEERALAVAAQLVRRGISCERLLVLGRGGWYPIASNETPAGRALNRRTVFVPIELDPSTPARKGIGHCAKLARSR